MISSNIKIPYHQNSDMYDERIDNLKTKLSQSYKNINAIHYNIIRIYQDAEAMNDNYKKVQIILSELKK